MGLGVGLASVTVPVYIAECSRPGVRAMLVTVNVAMITAGAPLKTFCNHFLGLFSFLKLTN